MVSAPFKEAAEVADIRGSFGEDSRLSLSEELWASIKAKRTPKISIGEMNSAPKKIVKVTIAGYSGSIKALCGSSGEILMGRCGQVRIDARVGHSGRLLIGDKTTVNGARFIVVGNTIVLGQDNMLSDEILLQGFDQHGIIDVATREFLNAGRTGIVTGRHVWIGRRATIMPATAIGSGSIIAACSLVNLEVPANAIAAGVPARIVREGATWTRPFQQIDADSAAYLDSLTSEPEPEIAPESAPELQAEPQPEPEVKPAGT